MKKFHTVLYSSLAIILIIATFFFSNGFENSTPIQKAQAATTPTLKGYGWSETIGWISFSDANTIISQDAFGNLNGYGWSEHIGWVKFGGLNSFPTGGSGTTQTNARITGNALVGWIKFCGGMNDEAAPPNQTDPNNTCTGTPRTDGWDGWVSLNGTGYGAVLTGNDKGTAGRNYLSGYVWGSDVVGWVDMSNAYIESSAFPLPTPVLNIDLTTGVGCSYDAVITWNDEQDIPPGNNVTYTLQRTFPPPQKNLTVPPHSGTTRQVTDTGLSQNQLYTYSLTATNDAGTVNVQKSTTTPSSCSNLPIIDSFTCVPSTVTAGDKASLTYSGIQNVNTAIPGDSCQITGPGVNTNLATTTDGSKQSGNINSTSRYTILCRNSAGTASKQTLCSLKPAFIEF